MPYKDPEAMRKYKREWVARRRADFFDGRKCVKCGSANTLELDHIDPTKKLHHTIWTWSAARRDAEIAKCQILCHACHRAKTIAQMPITHGHKAYRHGTMAMYFNHKCKCGLCRLCSRNYQRDRRARLSTNSPIKGN